MSRDAFAIVLTVVVIGVVALVGVGILGSLGTVALDLGVSADSAEINAETGETTVLDEAVDQSPTYWDVSLTQGHAVQLSGDGYVDASMPDGWDDGSWTVCSVGALDDSVNEEATYSLVAVENETLRLDYSDGEWSAIYRQSDTASATATLAHETPTSPTPACVRFDNETDELQLQVDEQQSDPVVLDSQTEQRDLANNWVGTVDETRVFNEALDDSTLSTYSAEPAAGLGVEDSARWMYEEGEGDATSAYYHDDTATLVNAGWTSGVGGPDLVEGEDYDADVDPLSITPLAGGFIDGSPVLYVAWDTGLGGQLQSLLEGIGGAFSLIPVVLLVLLASVVVAVVARMQS